MMRVFFLLLITALLTSCGGETKLEDLDINLETTARLRVNGSSDINEMPFEDSIEVNFEAGTKGSLTLHVALDVTKDRVTSQLEVKHDFYFETETYKPKYSLDTSIEPVTLAMLNNIEGIHLDGNYRVQGDSLIVVTTSIFRAEEGNLEAELLQEINTVVAIGPPQNVQPWVGHAHIMTNDKKEFLPQVIDWYRKLDMTTDFRGLFEAVKNGNFNLAIYSNDKESQTIASDFLLRFLEIEDHYMDRVILGGVSEEADVSDQKYDAYFCFKLDSTNQYPKVFNSFDEIDF